MIVDAITDSWTCALALTHQAQHEQQLHLAGKDDSKKRRNVERRVARSTSRFRGVTHHCRTGRWEAHLWKNGKQVYLGGFSDEAQAALAYDLAAIKARGA